ncbi:MAG: sulfate permease [Magnetococcales bacterium]|nr:sulfate permease [Magnetococcales bacterium]
MTAIMKKIFPFLVWMPQLNRRNLGNDFIAGITVALVLIPQSMAYANLAGLPAYYGLYAAFLPGAVAGLFGSSRQLATGPVAVVSLLTASALAPLATLGSDGYIALAVALSLMVGLVQISLGLMRLGVVVNFLSHPVIIGFTNAAAIIIGLSQLSKIFGVQMGRSEHFLVDILGVLQQIGQTHLPSLIFGVAAFVIMMALKKYRPKLPNVLIAVSLTTLLSWLIGFQNMGGKVVGTIPAGLPSLSLPHIDGSMIASLLANAVIISLVGFMEAISIAKAMAARTKTALDPNQELIGQGLANMVGSLTQAYPVSGSFSRSAVNINAGAFSGASSLFTAISVLITLLFLTPLLYHLPEAVLAAVIMMAVVGLVNFKAISHAWHASRHDGVASVVTFLATLGFAPHLDHGILLGAGLSILLFLYRTMQPRVAFLGRYQDGTLRDLLIHPQLPDDDRIIVMRFDGQLYFANVSYFEDSLLSALEKKPKAKYLLVVGDGINQLDASGEEVIRHLVERLQEHGMALMFSGLKRQVLTVMRNTGLFDLLGGDDNIFASDDIALRSIYQRIGDPDGPCPLMPGR